MKSTDDCCTQPHSVRTDRRQWLKTGFGAGAMAMVGVGVAGMGTSSDSQAAALTQAQRDALTPDDVIAQMKKGNQRFRAGKMRKQDFLAQKRASASGQFPAAVILSCIDSRAPAEIVLDTGIGDTFNARIAGNIANNDLIGSLEFACAAAGAKLVLVMGHTACGAVRGAIDGVQLGSLTGLLDTIKPAIGATNYTGDRSGKNAAFVDAVAATNVKQTMDSIRRHSTTLAELERKGQIKIVGAMYDIATGQVDFMA